MPKYQLPQFIDIEDKILGPLTLRQFLYFLGAGAILFIFWTLLKFEYFLVAAIIVLGLATMFAFIKINGRPFHYFISNFIKFIFKPQRYIWKREKTPSMPKDAPGENLPHIATKQSPVKKDVSEGGLKKLAWRLDIKENDNH